MSDMNINHVLSQMRTMSLEAAGKPKVAESSGDFASMLKASIDSVNQSQKSAKALADDFEMGNNDVSLAEVMIASQKASVSFQAMLQVRNKVVDAYKEVMGMQM